MNGQVTAPLAYSVGDWEPGPNRGLGGCLCSISWVGDPTSFTLGVCGDVGVAISHRAIQRLNSVWSFGRGVELCNGVFELGM